MTDWKRAVDDATQRRSEAAAHDEAATVAGNERAERFISDKAYPAFTEFAKYLETKGYSAKVSRSSARVNLIVEEGGSDRRILNCTMVVGVSPNRVWPKFEDEWENRKTGKPYRTVEGTIRHGNQDYSVEDITKEEILTCLAGKLSEGQSFRGA